MSSSDDIEQNSSDSLERSIYSDLLPLMCPYSKEFFNAEYGRGTETYIKRLKFIGLTGHKRVLDAGGGIGQWALALARENERVDVVDIRTDRLLIGQSIAQRTGVRNVTFQYGNIESLPFPDQSFDALICYSVFMFADRFKGIREFKRVLRPGGKLYVMVDLWRWPFSTVPAGIRRFIYALKFFVKKIIGIGPTLYSRSSFDNLIASNGFTIIRQGQEGFSYFGDEEKTVDPRLVFYSPEPQGSEKLWEICALRNGESRET
jgi:SAM-dependent methyltransferase